MAFILFICFVVICICVFSIFGRYLDKKQIMRQVKSINDTVLVREYADNDKVELVGSTLMDNINEDNPYLSYVKLDLIDVDFSFLIKRNDEVKGWIQIGGTDINYPFVQHNDNGYYLRRDFNRSKNRNGWMFLDYRNDISKKEKNKIVYAHNFLDSMTFDTLKDVLSDDWYKDVNNHVIKVSTLNENTIWQVFSIYRIPRTDDYLQVSFNSDYEYNKFLRLLVGRSAFNFKTDVSVDSDIITFSARYSKNEDIVMHAKLIKREVKWYYYLSSTH